MKTKIRYWGIALFTCLALSCSDFLEETPNGKMATVNLFNTRNGLDVASHNLYLTYLQYADNNERWCSFALGSDMQARPSGCGDGELDYEMRNWAAGNKGVDREWSYLYRVVKAANFYLNNAGNAPAAPEVIEAYMAQAYFWRAWAYFRLVSLYGPVPLVLDEDISYDTSPVSVAGIWEKAILPDMEKAEKAPAKWSDISGAAEQSKIGNNGAGNSWVTQAAAKAFTAYLYLSYAGWPNNKTEYYARAAEKAKEVIDGVENGTYPYALLDNYSQVYSKVHELENTESLLSVYQNMTASSSVFSGWDSYCQAPGYLGRYVKDEQGNTKAERGGGWSEIFGEIKFWKDFPEGPRKDALYPKKTLMVAKTKVRDPLTWETIITVKDTLADWWRGYNEEEFNQETYYHLPWFGFMITQSPLNDYYYEGDWDYRKGFTGCSGVGDKAFQILRLSEVYCWYAEAVGRSGQGDAALAAQLLTRLSQRADKVPKNYTGLTGAALAEAAWKEHRWEMAGTYWGNIAPVYFDELRMDYVKTHFEYQQRNEEVEVASGVKIREWNIPAGEWSYDRIYVPYPDADADMNPNLKK
jgi:hypothetical protein